MSAENKKLLWIAIAVVAVVLVLAGTAVAFFYPHKGGGSAPAAIRNTAAPKAADPQDYLAAPQLEPTPAPVAGQGDKGDVIVIYGDKPGALNGEPGEGAAAIAATAATATTNPAAGTAPAPGQSPSAGALPPPAAAATPPATTATTATTAKPKATQAKPQAKAASATAMQKPAPRALPPSEQYWIQAAAFSSRGKADDLKDVLAKKGLSGLVTVKEIGGKSWYRVRVGPYISNSEASGWLTRVKAIPGCEEAGIWKGSATAK